jgi:hypothetical protein
MFTSRKKKIINLYENILGRVPDDGGLNYYLNSNLTIEEIKNSLLNCSERKNMLFNNNILLNISKIYNIKSKTVLFCDTDTENCFIKNKKTLGKKWIWNNKPIEYKINSLGYRMNEFDEIDWSNYMAVFGCSHTFGTGMPLDDLFSTKISKDLKLDIVNASIPGGSNNSILINLCKLLHNKSLPKFIICNWTFLTRWSYIQNDTICRYGIGKKDIGCDYSPSYVNYIENDSQLDMNFNIIKEQVDTLCKLSNVPVWHITSCNGYESNNKIDKIFSEKNHTSIEHINKTCARDFLHTDNFVNAGHFGYKYQENVFNKWLQIKNTFRF